MAVEAQALWSFNTNAQCIQFVHFSSAQRKLMAADGRRKTINKWQLLWSFNAAFVCTAQYSYPKIISAA